ncbi:MAG: orotate phosphoribosyltransferase [Candidatus Geothermincolales bacterium]
MNPWEVMDILQERGAVEKGHFGLSSGLHSDTYVQCAKVLQYPHLAESLADAIASSFRDEPLDLVASPAMGAVILGYMVALSLGKRMIFAERVNDRLTFRRGLKVQKGEKVLLVEDVITTGSSLRELMELVKGEGGEVLGIGALIERGEGEDFGVKKRTLVQLKADVWKPEECPLCARGLPLEVPGSRGLH